ncbi:MAG: hypothetical protein ABEJ73_12785 [Haloplanus sp.]
MELPTSIMARLKTLSGRRTAFAVVLVLLLVPILGQAATYQPPANGRASAPPSAINSSDDVTFVTIQGNTAGKGAAIYAVDTESKAVLWSHDSYYKKYFDVDPLDDSTILFTAMVNDWPWNGGESYPWYAIIYDWRNDTLIDKFPVPADTHDVDYIGGQKYVIADKTIHNGQHEAYLTLAKKRGWISDDREATWHRLYVYNNSKDDIVWEYNFSDHYPETAGDGIGNHQDFTHVNDVDLVLDGRAFLTSPREFDRVLLINRTTKETIWELGQEDNYSILHEQHNPVLLSNTPPTVLVADSENNRVVEYEKRGDEWVRTWLYAKGLDWPRDADRLPNGNTLVTDTANGRIIELTPQGEIAWQYNTTFGPYDAERLAYGDEPRGPRMSTLNGETTTVQEQSYISARIDQYFFLSQWVLPRWVDRSTFWLIHLWVLMFGGWSFVEIRATLNG